MVIDEAEGTRLPFLRGILTRSLQDAGVPFEPAYEIASEVRLEVARAGEMTTEELRARVLPRLEPFGADVHHRYLTPPAPASIQVIHDRGQDQPFSRGGHRLSLVACGLAPGDAARVAARVYDDLVMRGVSEIGWSELRHLTYRHLVGDLGEDAARRYLVWQEFLGSNRTLVVLLGGAVGSGKSTVAAQLAHRLEIVRTQSTDILREVMRMMVPERIAPVLHRSSFLAWHALPAGEAAGEEPPLALVRGYLAQSELVAVACEAVIRRAARERVSLIFEGVHNHPGLLPGIEEETGAIVVRVMLAVPKRSHLQARIRGRGKHEPDRRAKRYLKHFDAIWDLQSFMLSEADQLGVSIVANDDLEDTVHELVGIVTGRLSQEFTGTPKEVF
jgi:2-phosphoglycerate kinase